MYDLYILVQGFPGRAPNIGGVGWSTVSLLRGRDGIVLIDTGSYNHRPRIVKRLAELGLRREDVTAVLLTHPHYDHCVNYPFFPNARVYVSKVDLGWAASIEPGTEATSELHIADMLKNPRIETIAAGDEVLPGIVAFDTAGHTPGHLGYRVKGVRGEIIFTGDSVKNRAELASRTVDMTYDMAQSQAAIDRIRVFAQSDPENLIVPGHDTVLGYENSAVVGKTKREIYIRAWMSTDFDDVTVFDLTQPPPSK